MEVNSVPLFIYFISFSFSYWNAFSVYALLKLLMINGVLKRIGLEHGFVKHGLTLF